MAYLLEIVGSSFIGGMIIFIILNLNSNVMQNAGEMSFDKIAQENLTSLVEEIEYDLKKIGYRSPDPKIVSVDTNAITFRYDIDNNGSVETISYFTSDTTILSNTPNPRDIFLYRTVNGSQPQTSNLGVTRFRLWYYDASGNLTSTPADIRSIKFALNVESLFTYNDEYVTTYIERLIQPNNLR
ncbi:MAG: hypothetical protein QY331_14850 [Melioribacteraceae bacterium]|nr:hypothetical protein [Melioribacteraceae bacterium]RJP58512.1 MAG: hypothetical protein C4543_08220 [Ignavibacteriales bacterium]WKZ69238.1 MAG: hypothetical protein QY331_14850 [Melioribacteraceae bacterium]